MFFGKMPGGSGFWWDFLMVLGFAATNDSLEQWFCREFRYNL
jgi:hypothetical protein